MLSLPLIEDNIVYASLFSGQFAFLLSIIIGLIATQFAFRAAKRMGGGLFGVVLNYMAIGMLLIVIGTITILINPYVATIIPDPLVVELWTSLAHTSFFSLGFIFLVLGAEKLLKGINAH